MIGVGRIGALHARTLASTGGVSEVVVADGNPERAAAVAAALGAGTATVDELFDGRVDAVAIATATAGHAALLIRAARAGLPAFCEKPVALGLEALDEAAHEVDRAGTLVQIGFQRRFDPGFRAAHDAVAAGEVGKLLVLRAATHDPAPPAEAYIAASGGIFRDLHVHDFDAVRFVTGREIVEVYADGAVRETEWFAAHGDVDVAVAVLRLDDGSFAIVSGTRHDPRGYDVRLEVFGTRDSLVVGVDARTPYRSVEPGADPPLPGYPTFLERFELAYRAELAAFVDSVRAGGPSACTLADTRAALAAALAADRSRAERRPVAVKEVTPVARSCRDRGRTLVSRQIGIDSEEGMHMSNEFEGQMDELESLTVDRRGLLLKGGLAAAGLTILGSPAAALAARSSGAAKSMKLAVVTHGDTGSFWSVFKAGVDQAAKDLKARGISVSQVYANNDVAKQVAGINAADRLQGERDRDVGSGCERAEGRSQHGGEPGHRDHHGQLRRERVRRRAGDPEDVHDARRPGRRGRRRGRRQAVQPRGREVGRRRDPRSEQLRAHPARRGRQEDVQGQDEHAADPECEVGHPGHRREDQGVLRGEQGDRRAARPRSGRHRARDRGRSGGTKIGTFDLNGDVITNLESGKMLFAIDQQQYLQGYLPVVFSVLFLTNLNTVGGGKPVLTGPGIVNKANAAKVAALAKAGTR